MPHIIFKPVFSSPLLVSVLALLFTVNAGCARNEIHASVKFDNIALAAGDLEKYGLGFITPSSRLQP